MLMLRSLIISNFILTIKYVLVICGILVITSCKTSLKQTTVQLPIKQLQALETWQIRGRISIKSLNKNNKIANAQASINWHQQGKSFQGKIQGPLGSNKNIITGDANSLTLKLADGKVIKAASPAELFEKHALPKLPINYFKSWLKGIPYAAEPITNKILNEHTQIVSFQQYNWQIIISEYMAVSNFLLPKRLRFTDDNLDIKIVISNWKIHNA